LHNTCNAVICTVTGASENMFVKERCSFLQMKFFETTWIYQLINGSQNISGK